MLVHGPSDPLDDAERRRRAAEAPGSLAKDDPDVRGALQDASDDPDERVKWAAKNALDPEYGGD
jgi:hypothetical protein